jgi:hypothetical protein
MTIHEIVSEVSYSFLMAPFYLIGDDELLKSQLLNLNNQTDKSFEVIIPDPHYSKREWIKDFCKNLDYNLIHYKYETNFKIPRTFDYGIFNNASLISNSENLIIFQDWRFCHHELVERLKKTNYEFIGFNWQVLYTEEIPLNSCNPLGNSQVSTSTHHPKSTIEISTVESKILYENGIFPIINVEENLVNTFHNSCWGHYCISKKLWMEINGIDEVSTNTRHYADLDINARLQEYFRRNNKIIEIPMLKNAMVRLMHNRGNFFGGSNVELDYKVNIEHMKCCFVGTSEISAHQFVTDDKKFTHYVIDKIKNGEFSKLYEIEYSENFKNNNKNERLDNEYYIIGFQCNKCKVVAETPYWYEKSPNCRAEAMFDIGTENFKIGKNIKFINSNLLDKTIQTKIEIVANYWNE